ncbi:hypothetical protein S83_063222, partial [Arachis hypogaea]
IQESDEARKKFSNAKSLSSSQFFGDQNKAANVADQATLSKFSNWASTSLVSKLKGPAERKKLEDLTIGPVLTTVESYIQ